MDFSCASPCDRTDHGPTGCACAGKVPTSLGRRVYVAPGDDVRLALCRQGFRPVVDTEPSVDNRTSAREVA